MCQEWEGRGSNPMLLISANEHNLEGRLSSYIRWLDDCGEEWKASERGGESCAVVSHRVRSLCQAVVPSLSLSLYCSAEWKIQKAKQMFKVLFLI